MKHQVLILVNFSNPDENTEMMFTPGFVRNCVSDSELMSTLAACAEFSHDVEVKTLEDNEPWPTLMERLEE